MLGAQSRRKLSRDAGTRAKQEETEFPARTHRGKKWNEVGSGDRRWQRAALPPRRPHNPGSVGQAEVGSFEHAREVMVLAGSHDKLRVDRRHEVMAHAIDHRLDSLEGGSHVHAVHPHAQHAGLLHPVQFAGSQAGDVFVDGWRPAVSTLMAVSVTEGITGPR
jgi:hypothetical protein